MKIKAFVFAMIFVIVLSSAVSAGTWMIKQDVLQPFSGERCAFESVLAGADKDLIFEGGGESTSNSFGTPWWSLEGNSGGTHITWTGNRMIGSSSSVRHSFGAAGTGLMPRVTDTYWRGCPRSESIDIDIVPGVSVDSISDPFTNLSMVTISNTTKEAIRVNNISYLNRANIELEDLNHDILRRGLFTAVDILPDMQLLLGESFTFPVQNARRTDFLILKFDVEYAVSSELENLYTGTVETWFAHRQLDQNPVSIRAYDIDSNLYIDDHEFFKALDDWIKNEISDTLFFEIVDAWVQRLILKATDAAQAASLNTVDLSNLHNGITFAAQGSNIAALGVEIYGLSGNSIYRATSLGTRLHWNQQSFSGQQAANGVYLYVVHAYGPSGDVVSSEVRKLVILR